MFKSWIVWLWRAWPLWGLLAITATTFLAVAWTMPVQGSIFNKVVGASLQSVGAFLVLVSINGNLGLFRKQSLFSLALGWARGHPRPGQIIELSAVATTQSNSSAALSFIGILPQTIDGRVAELERIVEGLQIQLTQNNASAMGSIAEVRLDFTAANSLRRTEISELASRIELATVGGVKMQVFGVGLAILGAVVSVFA